jgi:Tfp pilus assembly protein PilN
MKQINLYQAEFRQPRVLLPARKLLLSAAVFVAGLLLLYGLGEWQLRQLRHQVAQVVNRAEEVTRQVQASAPGVRQTDPAIAQQAQTLEARAHALQLAQEAIASGGIGSESGYSAQFHALARAVGNPSRSGAWLTGVTLSDNGRSLDLRGRALNGGSAARLIANLRREPLFVGLSFAELVMGPPQLNADQDATRPFGQAAKQPDVSPDAPRSLAFSLNARAAESATPTKPGAVP